MRLPEDFQGEFERPLDKRPGEKALTAFRFNALQHIAVPCGAMRVGGVSQKDSTYALLPRRRPRIFELHGSALRLVARRCITM